MVFIIITPPLIFYLVCKLKQSHGIKTLMDSSITKAKVLMSKKLYLKSHAQSGAKVKKTKDENFIFLIRYITLQFYKIFINIIYFKFTYTLNFRV